MAKQFELTYSITLHLINTRTATIETKNQAGFVDCHTANGIARKWVTEATGVEVVAWWSHKEMQGSAAEVKICGTVSLDWQVSCYVWISGVNREFKWYPAQG